MTNKKSENILHKTFSSLNITWPKVIVFAVATKKERDAIVLELTE